MNGPFAFKRGIPSGFQAHRVAPGEAASPSGVTAEVSGFSKLPLPPGHGAGLGQHIGGRAAGVGANLRARLVCDPATRPPGPARPNALGPLPLPPSPRLR